MDKNSAEWLNMVCPICNKRFHLKQCSVKRAKTHYCSRECHRIAKMEYMSGRNNHQYGVKGKENATWKHDIWVTRYGYIRKRVIDHPFRSKDDTVFEHRLVAEEYLLTDENSIEIDGKRYLRKEYDVHHINFNRKDNRPQNLLVMTKKEHHALHNKLNPSKRDGVDGRFTHTDADVIPKRTSEKAILPSSDDIGLIGYSLYYSGATSETIHPNEEKNLHTNIGFTVKKGIYGVVYARNAAPDQTGLRYKTRCVDCISEWDGEVCIPMVNDSQNDVVIRPREKIGIVVFNRPITPDLELTDKLWDSERGADGFGSSGK